LRLTACSLASVGHQERARRCGCSQARPSPEQPDDQQNLAEEGESGDVRAIARREQTAGAVDQIAEPGDHQQDPENTGHVLHAFTADIT
jgi:hypothetical protein